MLCSSHRDNVINPETAPIVTCSMSTGLAVRQSATSEQLAYNWSAMSHGLDLEKTSLVAGIVQYEYASLALKGADISVPLGFPRGS